jgi:hypothetical protein
MISLAEDSTGRPFKDQRIFRPFPPAGNGKVALYYVTAKD